MNFDESVREESLIDWEALKSTVPRELARCMKMFKGISIEDTRDCLPERAAKVARSGRGE